MAGLKKNKRQKDAASPNMVLVIFLILFVITSIILGTWVYFTYGERDRALAAATIAKKESAGDRKALEAYQIVANDLRLAIGQTLDPKDREILDVNRKLLFDDNGPYKDDKNRAAFIKVMADARNDLGFEDDKGEFKTTYQAKFKEKADEAEKYLASYKAEQKKREEAEAQFKTLVDKQDQYFANTTAGFDKQNKVALNEARKPTEEMSAQIELNKKLNAELGEAQQSYLKNEGKLKKEIVELKGQIRELETKSSETSTVRDNREPHALLLDVSLGKPLWDDPVGTITRVDSKAKEVTINLGTAKGIKPDMTFTVFGPSKYAATRAERQMKGTIEVTRVLGPNTSVARITSTFTDLDRDDGRARPVEMHEGDLLFNLFWGTHVAITGYANTTGTPSDSPSEQMRQLYDFIYLVQRQGAIVDAYLDLTDGQIKGAITPSTRFLIRGEDLRLDPKELENKEPRAERAQAVNNALAAMRKDAIDKGVFVISAKNFANVIGYRPAGAHANDQQAFTPSIPTAGSVIPNVGGSGLPPAAAAPQPAAPVVPPAAPQEKKGAEKE